MTILVIKANFKRSIIHVYNIPKMKNYSDMEQIRGYQGLWMVGGKGGGVVIKGYYKGDLWDDEIVLYLDGNGGGYMNLHM